LREADNNQEEVISFCLDISKRKQAEQEREQLLKENKLHAQKQKQLIASKMNFWLCYPMKSAHL